MTNLMFDTLDSPEVTNLPVALDTLGFIGTTIEGKLSLMALGKKKFLVYFVWYRVCVCMYV